MLVSRTPGGLDALPAGAIVGTSSPRRRALVLAARSDVTVEPLRGNVDTRLKKLESAVCDATVLAAAGLARLGVTPPNTTPLPVDTFVPAVGQGVLGIETREQDTQVRTALAALDDADTRACAQAERAFLLRLGASCVTPVAAHAALERGVLTMQALVVSEDGKELLLERGTAEPADAVALGRRLAGKLLERGAAAMVALTPREG